jgi:hypothetical protein
MKKQRVYYSPTSGNLSKKMGEFVPGEGYQNAGVREGSSVDINNALNAFAPVRRANTDNGPYSELVTGSAPWDGYEDGFYKNANADNLEKAGCKFIGRANTDDEATQRQVVAQSKYGRKVYVNAIEDGNGNALMYDLWMDATNSKNSNFQYAKVAAPVEMGGVAYKVKRNIIPKGVTKLAWDYAQESGYLGNMEFLGFGQYKEASAGKDPEGIWWKKSYTDGDTGETKYYLVKENGVENAVDVGGKNVKAVKSASNIEEGKVAEKIKKVKVASKIPIKKANVGSEREDAKDTPASKSVGVKNKTIDLSKSDWKKEVSDYVASIKKSGMTPKVMEIKIVDWIVNDFFSLNEDN